MGFRSIQMVHKSREQHKQRHSLSDAYQLFLPALDLLHHKNKEVKYEHTPCTSPNTTLTHACIALHQSP